MPLPHSNTTSDSETGNLSTQLAVLISKVGYIETEVKDITKKLESSYVTQDQFEPVKNVVYGLVSIILLAVVGALVGLVILK